MRKLDNILLKEHRTKLFNCIESCKTESQLNTAQTMVTTFDKIWNNNSLDFDIMLALINSTLKLKRLSINGK